MKTCIMLSRVADIETCFLGSFSNQVKTRQVGLEFVKEKGSFTCSQHLYSLPSLRINLYF